MTISKKIISFVITIALISAMVIGLRVAMDTSPAASNNSEYLSAKNLADKISEPDEDISVPNIDTSDCTEENVPELEDKLSEINVLSKQDVWHKMLNSIDYYDQVSGTVIYSSDGIENAISVNFQSDITASESYSYVVNVTVEFLDKSLPQSDYSALTNSSLNAVPNSTFDKEFYCYDMQTTTINNLKETYSNAEHSVLTRANSKQIPDEDRFKINSDGIPCYYYRANPTNVPDASICLFPQEMAFGFLTDFKLWDIDGIEEYLGRKCIVVSGATSDEYGKKVGVDKFIFYVDCKAGVLLKYEGYDTDGNLSDYMVADNIRFDTDADPVASFDKAQIANYSLTENR